MGIGTGASKAVGSSHLVYRCGGGGGGGGCRCRFYTHQVVRLHFSKHHNDVRANRRASPGNVSNTYD